MHKCEFEVLREGQPRGGLPVGGRQRARRGRHVLQQRVCHEATDEAELEDTRYVPVHDRCSLLGIHDMYPYTIYAAYWGYTVCTRTR